MSFLHIDLAQVVEILPQVGQELTSIQFLILFVLYHFWTHWPNACQFAIKDNNLEAVWLFHECPGESYPCCNDTALCRENGYLSATYLSKRFSISTNVMFPYDERSVMGSAWVVLWYISKGLNGVVVTSRPWPRSSFSDKPSHRPFKNIHSW